MVQAIEYRDSLRLEAKDWDKQFLTLHMDREKELADTRRALKERQEMFTGQFWLRVVDDVQRYPDKPVLLDIRCHFINVSFTMVTNYNKTGLVM